MNRKTLIALVLFLALLGGTYFLFQRPEKGVRTGERKRPLPALKARAIDQIALTSKGTEVILARASQDAWKLIKPVDYPADKYAVDTMLEKLEKLEFGDLVTELKERQADHEVDEKSGVRVRVEGGKKTLADFYLGKTVEDFTMLRLVGTDQVYQVVGSLRFVFEREPKNWRRRTITELKQEDLRRLEVEVGGEAIVLARADEKAGWKVERAPTGMKIDVLDESIISGLLSTFSSLSAFDFADGIDAAKSGLDKPSASITVASQAGTPVTLVVGGKKDDGYFVQKKGEPQVFILKQPTMENLLRRPIDFRDKTVLSFKADDVIALNIDHKKEKESVRLTLKGTDWLGNGKPVKDSTKIKTALEALASLKADGFAKPTAQELGMKTPEWVLELQLKDRTKHSLTVGGVEKDGLYGLTRGGLPDLFAFRKHSLDRFLLDPQSYK